MPPIPSARTEVRPRPVRGRRARALLAALVALAAGAAGYALTSPAHAGAGAAAQAAATPVPAPAVPSAAADGEEPSWQGGTLDVPAWGKRFDVVPVGLTADGALVPPESIVTLGWWSGGAAPGSGTGAVVLAVHRDSRVDGRGPFAALEGLPARSVVTLDGHRYTLVTAETYAKSALPTATLFAQDGPERLIVVTCGGDYDSGTGWDSNVVATFEPSDAA
jgi:hypothetical protein